MLKALILGAALGLVAMPALAAEIDCGGAEPVKSATLPIAACVDPAVWQSDKGTGSQEFIFFSKDQRAGFAIVTEDVSASMDAYRDAILAYATTQSGAVEGSVKAHDEAAATIAGKAWRTMRYNLMVQDTELEFVNYYYSAKGFGAVQFIFWSTPEDAAAVTSELAGPVIETVALTK